MHIARRSIVVLFLASTLAGTASAAESETKSTPAVTIGPFRTGMTMDELRAAGPDLKWQEGKSIESSYRKTLKAEGAVTLAGASYDVIATPGWYGEYELVFHRGAQVANAKKCTKEYEGLVADLEKRVGSFVASNHPYENESMFATRGKPTKTLNRKTGAGSAYTWHSTATYDESSAERHDGKLDLTVIGQYFVSSMFFGDSSCQTSFKIQVKGSPPAEEEIPTQSLKPIVSPSIALLHETTERLTLPAGGLTVLARCRVSRESGTVAACVADPKPSAEIAAAMDLRRAHMAFDTSALSPGNPVPLYSQIEFRFESSQRLRVGAAANLLTADAVNWKDELEAVPVRGLITSALSRQEYDSATVTATCQIQSDGSLLCTAFKVAPAADVTIDDTLRARFEQEARDRLRYRRAVSPLKNGDASSGRWVSIESPIKLLRLRRP